MAAGRDVVYVTDRAVFELREDGLWITEVAPGVDLQRDVLDRVDFDLKVADDLAEIPLACYRFD